MRIRLCGTAFCIVSMTWLATGSAFGQTNAVQSGNWSTVSTWSAGEPSTSTPAVINGGFAVTIDQAGESTNLLDVGTISAQSGSLNITGGSLLVEDANTTTEPNLPSIRIGQATGATGSMTMSGGDVFINSPTGGFAVGDLMIGDLGSGTFTMTGGNFTASDEMIIANAGNATGVVDVSSGSLATSGRSILVGFGGDGTLKVSGDASVTANFDMLIAFVEGSKGTFNQSGGTVNCNFMFSNSFTGGAGSTANLTMTGGTFNANIAFVMGQGNGTTVMNHSGGTINALSNNGDLVVADGDGNTSTYNISGTATVNLLHNVILGTFDGPEGPANGTINQTGGSITAGDNVRVGADGIGTYNLSAGSLTARNIFLGDFDSSSGTMKISGGTLNLAGNFSVGAALASNAAPDRVEPTGANGPQGQALDANGALIVSGTAGTINVGGNFLANPNDKSSFRRDPFIAGADNSSTLTFEIFNSSGTSLINVTGIADLDGAVVDVDLMSGFTPTVGSTFNLIKATSFGSTGSGTTENVGTGTGYTLAAEDAGRFSLAIVSALGGQVLRATYLGAPVLAGDYNNNGTVDAADYVVWRNNAGTSNPLPNDPLGGTIGASQYNQWRSHFGQTAGSGAALGAGAVPEPGALVLAICSACLGLLRRRGA